MFSPERDRFGGPPPPDGRFGPPLHPMERGGEGYHPMMDSFDPMEAPYMSRNGFEDYDMRPPYEEFPRDEFDPRHPPEELPPYMDPRDPRMPPSERDYFPPPPHEMFGPRMPRGGPGAEFGHRGMMPAGGELTTQCFLLACLARIVITTI
jgi:hypothetical protein